MSDRSLAVKTVGQRTIKARSKSSLPFGERVFGRHQIEQYLPKKAAANWLAAMDGEGAIDPEHLDRFADVLKDWAIVQPILPIGSNRSGQGAVKNTKHFYPGRERIGAPSKH